MITSTNVMVVFVIRGKNYFNKYANKIVHLWQLTTSKQNVHVKELKQKQFLSNLFEFNIVIIKALITHEIQLNFKSKHSLNKYYHKYGPQKH